MIRGNIVPFAIRPDLITAHPRPNLLLPKLRESTVLDLVEVCSYARLEDRSCSLAVLVL